MGILRQSLPTVLLAASHGGGFAPAYVGDSEGGQTAKLELYEVLKLAQEAADTRQAGFDPQRNRWVADLHHRRGIKGLSRAH